MGTGKFAGGSSEWRVISLKKGRKEKSRIRIDELTFSYGRARIYDRPSLHIPENQACLITGSIILTSVLKPLRFIFIDHPQSL